MGPKIKATIDSLRLRTLPLSLAGVCLGIFLAYADYRVTLWTAVLVMLTTALLQILSNLCNELGDVLHGTDTAERLGPEYGLNSGVLEIKDMKRLIAVVATLTAVSGLGMIKVSFGTLLCIEGLCLILLGAAAMMAAMKYTLGRNPYGYRGLGDLYVFIFFGLVSVLGSYVVCAHTIKSWTLLLPASTIGFFSMGVLNVNNIRDMKTDAATRVTVALRLGERNAKIYQSVLIVLGWACMVVFTLLRFQDIRHWLYVLTLPLFISHLRGVWTRTGSDLDPMLPQLVMSSFTFALLAGLGFVMFLL